MIIFIVSSTFNFVMCGSLRLLMPDGEFSQKVHADDCMWTLEDQNTVHLSLEKVDRMRWWSCVLKGDPEIDTKTIVPEVGGACLRLRG